MQVSIAGERWRRAKQNAARKSDAFEEGRGAGGEPRLDLVGPHCTRSGKPPWTRRRRCMLRSPDSFDSIPWRRARAVAQRQAIAPGRAPAAHLELVRQIPSGSRHQTLRPAVAAECDRDSPLKLQNSTNHEGFNVTLKSAYACQTRVRISVEMGPPAPAAASPRAGRGHGGGGYRPGSSSVSVPVRFPLPPTSGNGC